MKLRTVSPKIKGCINTLRWSKRKNHWIVKTTDKLNRAERKELTDIIKSFGGLDNILHEYTLGYDARDYLYDACQYGYYYGVENNYPYLPPYIIDPILDLVSEFNNGRFLVPFAGYGNLSFSLSNRFPHSSIHVCDNKPFESAMQMCYLECSFNNFYWSQSDKKIDELYGLYNCIVLRPPLNIRMNYVYSCLERLASGGKIVVTLYTDKIVKTTKWKSDFDWKKYNVQVVNLPENIIDLNGDKEISLLVVSK